MNLVKVAPKDQKCLNFKSALTLIFDEKLSGTSNRHHRKMSSDREKQTIGISKKLTDTLKNPHHQLKH